MRLTENGGYAMNYATLTGEMEEKALIYVFNHYHLDQYQRYEDFMRENYGHCGFVGFQLMPGLSISAEMRTAGPEIIVRDIKGGTFFGAYKWPEFMTKARDAKTAHQTSLFEMMGT